MYFNLKLFLNTHNDTKNMYLDLDRESLFKIQGSAAEPWWFQDSILRIVSKLSANMNKEQV